MTKENYSTSIYNQLKRGVRNTLFYGLTAAVLSSPILPELTYAANKNSKNVRPDTVIVKGTQTWKDAGFKRDYRATEVHDPKNIIEIIDSYHKENPHGLGWNGYRDFMLKLGVWPSIVKDTVVVRDTIRVPRTKYVTKVVYGDSPTKYKTITRDLRKPSQTYQAPKTNIQIQPQSPRQTTQTPYQPSDEVPSEKSMPPSQRTLESRVNQEQVTSINQRINQEFRRSGSKWPWIVGGLAAGVGIYFLLKGDNEETTPQPAYQGGERGGTGVK